MKSLFLSNVCLVAMSFAVLTPVAYAQSNRLPKEKSEWHNYAGDKGSSKYSPLTQINVENFKNLKVAWRWKSPDDAILKANPTLQTWLWECTPLMADGILYASTSLSQVAALDAATGKTLWVYDPETWKAATPPPNHGFVHRGVAYWAKGSDRRILYGTGDGYLICLDARTGKPVPSFGKNGRVDLTEGLGRKVERNLYGVSSPPVICRDVVVVGSSVLDFPLEKAMPPGNVRGFDVRTGEVRWNFASVASAGQFGSETWEGKSGKVTGGANVWTMMSADEKLGYVYLPFGTPANDFYGGNRLGNGLFGDSLVCVEARTGKRVWHFQMVHHGLWDYDLPAAPNLIDITVNGKRIKAVAQVSKQGFCYVLDRVTGKPIFPIEERPVPASSVSGERASLTQPFPTKPAPFDRQGVTENDIVDFTPELHTQALKVLAKYNYGGLFTPPTPAKPTILSPGVAGGANWAGAACDPETGRLYVPSITLPFAVYMVKSPLPHTEYIAVSVPVESVQGVPLFKPPYGRLTAIDLNTGDHKWQVPMGDLTPDDPIKKRFNLPQVGRPARGHILLTKTLLIGGQEGNTQRGSASPKGYALVADFISYDPKLCAYDKETGKVVGEITLPRNVTGAPMTYFVNGKQYLVVTTGGANLPAEIIALALP